MKSIYLFCTQPWVYLTEVPVLTLLSATIAFNGNSEKPLKFYPLIIFLVLSAAFIFVYFFRVLSINAKEIRYYGLFSSKDCSSISKNRTLIISIRPFANIRFEIYEDASEAPAFEWMSAEDVAHRKICIFRGRSIGGRRTVKRVLEYFAVQKEKVADFYKDEFFYEDERITITAENTNEIRSFKIHFNEAIA